MRIVIGVLLLLCGYLVGAVGGYTLLLTRTSNTHDGPVEAAMTGAFVAGPAVALLAVAIWLVVSRPRSPR